MATAGKKQSYLFGPFRLDVAERRLLCGDQTIPLPPKVFDTLTLLVENNGRLITKDELIASVWPDTFVEEVTIAHNISDLKKALSEASGGGRFIETVPKHGYRFTASVVLLIEEPPARIEKHNGSRILTEQEAIQDVQQESSAPAGETRKPTRRLVRPGLLVGISVVLLAAAIIYFGIPGIS